MTKLKLAIIIQESVNRVPSILKYIVRYDIYLIDKSKPPLGVCRRWWRFSQWRIICLIYTYSSIKGLVTEHFVPMHHAFGMSSLTTSRLLIVCKTSRNSWKHCYFEGVYLTTSIWTMTTVHWLSLKRFWTL